MSEENTIQSNLAKWRNARAKALALGEYKYVDAMDKVVEGLKKLQELEYEVE